MPLSLQDGRNRNLKRGRDPHPNKAADVPAESHQRFYNNGERVWPSYSVDYRAYIQYQVNGLPVGASSAVRKTHSEEAQADTEDALSFKDDYTNSGYQDLCFGRSARVKLLLQVPLLQMLLPYRFH